MEEIEVKVLEVQPDDLQAQLTSLGAVFEFDHHFEAWFFDRPTKEITQRGDLLRLRREGDSSVLAYKQKISTTGAKVMKETETHISDAGNMIDILTSLGYVMIKSTQKRRIQYLFQDCHVVIDDYEGELAMIPPFMEIEAPSRQRLAEVLAQLGIKSDQALPWSTYDLVKHYGLDTRDT